MYMFIQKVDFTSDSALCFQSVTLLKQPLVSTDPASYVILFQSRMTPFDKQEGNCVLKLKHTLCSSSRCTVATPSLWLSVPVCISHLLFTFFTALVKPLCFTAWVVMSAWHRNTNFTAASCSCWEMRMNGVESHWLQTRWAGPSTSNCCFHALWTCCLAHVNNN